jgi:cytochrome c peroxidase
MTGIRHAVFGMMLIASFSAFSEGSVVFTEAELGFIQSHGSWPPVFEGDSSNRLSGDPRAIVYGERLFSDLRLSRDGSISCATCHAVENNFVDGRPLGKGLQGGIRNTPGTVNLAFNRWFGWGGGADSLWMQNIRPIVSPSEMDGVQAVRNLHESDLEFGGWFRELQGKTVQQSSDEEMLVLVGKAMAAFLETRVTGVTPFDRFRLALLSGDQKQMQQYPVSAQRGLKIFSGRGQCSVCHFGPGFTNGEFAEIGISYFTFNGVDNGRFNGIENVKTSALSLLGKYNDAPQSGNADKTRFLRRRHDSFGQFRIPGLRSVAKTGPYMHNGSLKTLHDVLEHYSHIDLDRLHTDGQSILKPLNLNETEIEDLVSFLESLNDDY